MGLPDGYPFVLSDAAIDKLRFVHETVQERSEETSMNYTNLGKTGLKVSRLCLGCMSFGVPQRGMHAWTLDEEQSRPFIQRALELGINFFDTANSYSDGTSEEILGRAIRDFARRDEVVIATKVFHRTRRVPNGRGLSRKAIMAEIDASLRRLGTDHVDLYQIHRWDHETPIEETLEALHDVVKAGKARYLGASSMYAWQFCQGAAPGRPSRLDAVRIDAEPLQSALPRGGAGDASAVRRSRASASSPGARWPAAGWPGPGTRSAATERAATDEFGKTLYARTEEADRAVVERVGRGRRPRRGMPRAQVALAWLLAKPGRHLADRRRDASRTISRTRWPPCRSSSARGDFAARGTVRAASGARVLMRPGRIRAAVQRALCRRTQRFCRLYTQ